MKQNSKHPMAALATLSLLTILSGCGGTQIQPFSEVIKPTPISAEKIATADYGVQPSEGYQEIVKTELNKMLLDPTSPIYTFDQPPEKGFIMHSQYFGTWESFGWKVCGTVNSKNRYGGYVGAVPFMALMQGDTVIQKLMGGPTGGEPKLSLMSFGIQDACNRKL